MTNIFFTFYKGKYKRILFTIIDQDTNEPENIGAHSFDFTVKRSVLDVDADAIFVKTLSNGISIVDAATGKGQIDIAPEDTASLPNVEQNIVWDLQIVRSGNPEIVGSGRGQISLAVTRSAT